MSGDLQDNRSAADSGEQVPGEDSSEVWAPQERALLDAALDFYAAAESVIDYSGEERPQLRRDAAGFDAVRKAMATLEDRVRDAHAVGVDAERIAQIARIEQEMVELILSGRETAAPSSAES